MSLTVKVSNVIAQNPSSTQPTVEPAGTVVEVTSGIIQNNTQLGSRYYTKDEIDAKGFTNEEQVREICEDYEAQVDNELITKNDDNEITINPIYRTGSLAVADMIKRNALDKSKLEIGTRCWVETAQKFYKLILSPGDIKVWADDNQTETFDNYATSERHGTVALGANLRVNAQGQTEVDVVDKEEKDSKKPISAGAVYDILGNLKIVLDNI